MATATNTQVGELTWLNIGARRWSNVNDFFFQGDIAEVISYDQTLSATARLRVASYLATKYGITLNHSYLNGRGDTTYSLLTNTGYVNNIIGIGREDCQGLHQRQSLSANATGLLMIGNNNIIDEAKGNASNAGNDISTDASYLIIGDNGAVPKWNVTGAPAGQFNILSRVWRARETGTIGSVKLSFFAPRSGFNTVLPQGNETGKLYLTISPDAVFNDNNNTVLPLTFDGKYWTANADLTSGQFFTIYKEVDYPGGIVTAPMVWYRADVPGPTPTTKWYDQGVSDGDVTATAAFTDPKTSTRLANYNPSYTFDGVKYFTSAVSDLSFLIADQDLFGVSMQTSTGTTGWKLFFGLGTNATSYARNAIGFSNNRPAFLNTGTNGADYIGMSTNTTGLNWQLLQGSRTASTVTQSSWGEAGFQTSSVASGVTIGTLDHISVGTHRYYGNPNSNFDGWVPEVMAFGQTLTTDQRNRVRTYLGLKYGITLDHNYFDGTGTKEFIDSQAAYPYGFSTPIESETFPKGLSEETVRAISAINSSL